ncbi:MAG: radical SAM protein [Elusimicrobia bacterium]|nr:radical SAM protein [Elusimicrobiota bacterium]
MEPPLYRPPAEAESLLLRIDQGCPYNRCSFCGMYRDRVFRRSTINEAEALISRSARRNRGARRVFLADGDVMARPFEDLSAILGMLQKAFPSLARVNVYATGSAIAAKTDEQLSVLRSQRLHTLYMGLESGDEETLRRCRKAETARLMVEAGLRAQARGLHMSVMALLGLGGRERTSEHALATASALNLMKPKLLSFLRVIPVPGTRLQAEIDKGEFLQLTEYETVQELRAMVQVLELERTVFRANHSSNIVPLEAALPRDKARLLEELDDLLASGGLDRKSPGRMPSWL